MKFEKFTVKDIIFLAILSAVLMLAAGATMPLVMYNKLFGIRNIASSLVYGLFCMIGLMKVKKFGTLTIIGLFNGFILLMMAPVMFWNMALAPIASELITFAIFKSYESDKAKVLASTLLIPLTIPVTLVFTMLLHGMTFSEVVTNPTASIALCIGTVVISYISSKLGQKLGIELQKAGKL